MTNSFQVIHPNEYRQADRHSYTFLANQYYIKNNTVFHRSHPRHVHKVEISFFNPITSTSNILDS